MVQKAIPDIFFAKGYEDSNITTQEYLRVNNCGYSKNNPNEDIVKRPNGRKDYQLIYLEKGTGSFLIRGKRVQLTAGQLYIFYPNEPQLYSFAPFSSYYWLHFTGTGAAKILADLELENALYSLKLDQFFLDEFMQIQNFCSLGGIAFDTFLAGHLMSILANISRYSKISDTRIYKVIAAMQNFEESYTNSEYAQMCDMSEYHFIRKFKQITGLTPHRYKEQLIVQRAIVLLNEANLNISQIAQSLGFENPLYFSRMFKKATGFSPKKHNKNLKE